MKLSAEDVERSCTHLTPLFKQLIRKQLLDLDKTPPEYSLAASLLFWVADWLTAVKLMRDDQLLWLLGHIHLSIVEFGDEFDKAWSTSKVKTISSMRRLPVCKLGILDRTYVCIDGRDAFFDLTNGEVIATRDERPIETIIYNLTSLCIRYLTQTQRKKS